MSDTFPRIPDSPPQDRVDAPPPPPPPPPPPVPVAAGPYRPGPASLPPQPAVAGLAVASLVLAILWIWWIGSLLAVIFGHVALSQIKRSHGWTTGRGMAMAGVVLGWVGLATLVIVLVAGIVAGVGDPIDTSDPVGNDASVLDGEYRYSWTLDELVAAGVPEETVRQFAMAGVYTWNLDGGRLAFISEFPDGSTVACTGTYQVAGDAIGLSLRPPCPLYHFTATWALTDDHLVMSNALLDGESVPDVEVWLAQKPWTKIG
ncbi:MAG TPA: DUF4190 domain-containing protein [Acidimicrobiales bacterium]|nr:DUF4190 domain-containing protein [Acidimicrobiales bacterium]